MSSHDTPKYLRGSVRRQMDWVANDQRQKLRMAWVDRILKFLENDTLIMQAAAKPAEEEVLIFECNFAPQVWDDPRITFRVNQLSSNDIAVDLVEHEHSVEGKTFKRHQIHVTF